MDVQQGIKCPGFKWGSKIKVGEEKGKYK